MEYCCKAQSCFGLELWRWELKAITNLLWYLFSILFFHNKILSWWTPTPGLLFNVACVNYLLIVAFIHVLCVRVNHVLFIVSFMCHVFVSYMFCYRFLFVSYMCHVFVSNNVIYVSFICFIYMCRLLCHFCDNDISFY